MARSRNNTGAAAAAVERPNIFAAPVGPPIAGRKPRPASVFDAAAACEPTHLAAAGGERSRDEQSPASRAGRLISVGWSRAALFIGASAAIVALLAASLSPVRDERTSPGSPTAPAAHDRAPAADRELRSAPRAPRLRSIPRARARKRSDRPSRSDRNARSRRRPVPRAPRTAPVPPPRFVPPPRAVPHRPVPPRLPKAVPAGAPPEFL